MKRLSLILFPLIFSLFLAACGEKSPSDGSAAAPAETASKPKTADELLTEGRNLRDGAPGVAVDKAKAFEVFTQADAAGEACASFFIAVMYENGELGSVDNQKALEWYTKSQEQKCGADPKRAAGFIAKHKK